MYRKNHAWWPDMRKGAQGEEQMHVMARRAKKGAETQRTQRTRRLAWWVQQ